MKKVLILGGSGMLGSMTVDLFSRDSSLDVTATVRSGRIKENSNAYLTGVNWELFETGDFIDNSRNYEHLRNFDYIINCIGITKPYCNDNNPREIMNAIEVNSLFPNLLAQMLLDSDTRILQIATDCVYSGKKGNYTETDKHDALDVYGKTKSLGESKYENIYNLRCSIIGPEFDRRAFLIEWFLNQPQNAVLNGYANHDWNGLTTLHFAKICLGIVKNDIDLPNLLHIIPTGTISKYEMLKCFADVFHRKDIDINKFEAPEKIDRTISTVYKNKNMDLWKAAGYVSIPTVKDLISEMAAYDYKFKA
jgi:dTDP-4-dehydrorhamnose reductase